MEGPGAVSEVHQQSSSNSRRFGMQLTSANLLPGPLSALLEFTGILRGRGSHHVEIDDQEVGTSSGGGSVGQYSPETQTRTGDGGAEVSIRIFGVGEPEQMRAPDSNSARNNTSDVSILPSFTTTTSFPGRSAGLESISSGPAILPQVLSTEERGEELPETVAAGNGNGNGNGRDAGSQRYDFQQLARWIEQALPFAILLFMVFIRQHLQGFLVVFWITVVMVKANDLLRKQTALKNERRPVVLATLGCALAVHVVGVYWWHSYEALWRPLILLPPQDIPNFGHAIFIIVVNDTLVRQSVMALKCGLLVYYRNSRGRNYRCQAQLLTLVEYVLLLYRALIPGPVWYRFFLNKAYGNLFSSLTTGLYLTFKLTSTWEKVQTFLAALRALSRREVQYGSYATSEEVLAAGDMCAICQEKMHAPIALRCNHIFCEDCVSEWFERERTCPLCRAVVRSVGLRSYGDGSTSLLIQLF